MKQVLAYLRRLQANNNRVWFNGHKSEYLEAQGRFNGFATSLIDGIRNFDASIAGVTLKDCTYRIYRDVRFSADKSPYKLHFGAFVAPGGRNSGYSGYYFQIGVPNESFGASGHILAAGNYYCEPKVLQILREDIEGGQGDFDRIVRQQTDSRFQLETEQSLKKVPAGFPKDDGNADYYRLKNFCLCYVPDDEFYYSPDLLDNTLELFHSAKPFIDYVNRAIAFVKEG